MLAAFVSTSGLLDQFAIYVQSQQSLYHRELAQVLRNVKNEGLIAMGGMITLSFLYGVFHAAGPGHGKAVISTYLLSNEADLPKGIALSFLSAFMQGITAIILILGAVYVLGWTRRQASDAVPSLEMASYLLVMAVGVLLITRGVRSIVSSSRVQDKSAQESPQHDCGHTHGHHHAHTHHHTGHEECADCGHSHAPDPKLLSSTANWKESLSIILSIGIRPCTGSLLVLIFAEAWGLRWSGVLSVLAISLGTAITVSLLACVAVYFRKYAAKLAHGGESPYLKYASYGVTILGGLIIAVFGLTLFLGASTQNHPLL